MDISNHPSVKSLRFNRRVVRVYTNMANALLLGLADKYSNTNHVASLSFISHALSHTVNSGSSSSRDSGEGAFFIANATAKFIFAYVSGYGNITETVTKGSGSNQDVYARPVFMAITNTVERCLLESHTYNGYTGSVYVQVSADKVCLYFSRAGQNPAFTCHAICVEVVE